MFDLDVAALERQYKGLQRRLHPDKYATASSLEREYAEQQAAAVNQAYDILKRPLRRAHYIVSWEGGCWLWWWWRRWVGGTLREQAGASALPGGCSTVLCSGCDVLVLFPAISLLPMPPTISLLGPACSRRCCCPSLLAAQPARVWGVRGHDHQRPRAAHVCDGGAGGGGKHGAAGQGAAAGPAGCQPRAGGAVLAGAGLGVCASVCVVWVGAGITGAGWNAWAGEPKISPRALTLCA